MARTYTLIPRGFIEVAQLRVIVVRRHSSESYSKMAERCGWYEKGRGDASRFLRTVGLSDWTCGRKRGYRKRKVAIRYEIAAHICHSLDIDPWEIGL